MSSTKKEHFKPNVFFTLGSTNTSSPININDGQAADSPPPFLSRGGTPGGGTPRGLRTPSPGPESLSDSHDWSEFSKITTLLASLNTGKEHRDKGEAGFRRQNSQETLPDEVSRRYLLWLELKAFRSARSPVEQEDWLLDERCAMADVIEQVLQFRLGSRQGSSDVTHMGNDVTSPTSGCAGVLRPNNSLCVVVNGGSSKLCFQRNN